jgi:hypothetical protein
MQRRYNRQNIGRSSLWRKQNKNNDARSSQSYTNSVSYLRACIINLIISKKRVKSFETAVVKNRNVFTLKDQPCMSAVLLALFRQIVGDDAASSVSACSCVMVSFVSSDSGGGVLQTFAWLIC